MELALARDPVQISDQQHPQQQFRIDGRSSGVAVELLQLGADEVEADMTIDDTEKMVLRNLIFEPEVLEQRLRAGVASHHEQQASENMAVKNSITNSRLLIM